MCRRKAKVRKKSFTIATQATKKKWKSTKTQKKKNKSFRIGEYNIKIFYLAKFYSNY